MTGEKTIVDPESVTEYPASKTGGNDVTKHILEHSYDADEAMKAFASAGEVITLDEETNKRILRKIDWNVMPVGFTMRLMFAYH